MWKENQSEEKIRRKVPLGKAVLDLIFSLVSVAGERMNSLVEKQERKMKKNIILIFVFVVGILYILKGLALFINDYMKTGEWVGYGLIGIVLIVLGGIFKK